MSWTVDVTRETVVAEVGPLPRLQTDEDRITVLEGITAYLNGLRLQTETTAWALACIARAAAPTIGRVLLVDQLVVRLKACSFFTWGAGLFIVGETKAQFLINLASPATVATFYEPAGHSLAFVADRYLKGDKGSLVQTNVTVGGGGDKLQQNSSFMYVHQVDDTRDNQNRMMGLKNAEIWLVPATAKRAQIRVRAAAGNYDQAPTLLSNGVGGFGYIRSSALGFTTMIAGELGDDVTRASTSITSATNVMRLFGGGLQFGEGAAAAFAFGAAPTLSQYAAMHDAITLYLRRIGATL